MSHPHQLTTAAQVLFFVKGGKARFTLVSKGTGTRFTYKVTAKVNEGETEPSIYFVSLLTGADNESSYSYLGHIWAKDDTYAHGKKSKIGMGAPSARAFQFFWMHLIASGIIHTGIEFWHEGTCCRCGRTLTVPESIESGVGPECAKKI